MRRTGLPQRQINAAAGPPRDHHDEKRPGEEDRNIAPVQELEGIGIDEDDDEHQDNSSEIEQIVAEVNSIIDENKPCQE